MSKKLIGLGCVDINWGYSKEGKLLFEIPDCVNYFNRNTRYKVVVMDEEYYNANERVRIIDYNLKIVLVKNSNTELKNCLCVSSIEDLKTVINSIQEDIYVLGGADLHNQLYDYYTGLIICKVHKICEPDKYFPCLNINKLFNVVNKTKKTEYSHMKIQYFTYERKVE